MNYALLIMAGVGLVGIVAGWFAGYFFWREEVLELTEGNAQLAAEVVDLKQYAPVQFDVQSLPPRVEDT